MCFSRYNDPEGLNKALSTRLAVVWLSDSEATASLGCSLGSVFANQEILPPLQHEHLVICHFDFK